MTGSERRRYRRVNAPLLCPPPGLIVQVLLLVLQVERRAPRAARADAPA